MDKLKVGVVGAAGRGGSFFSAITCNPRTQLEALCDINEEGVTRTAAQQRVAKVFTNYEEMLDKAGLDLVLVGTPMALHVPQSVAALERGIHVMCEVPAAVSLEEAQLLVKTWKASKAKYMMAENYCYMKPNVLVRSLVRAGLFGELYYGEGAYIHELKGLNEVTKWRRKWQTGINGNTYPTHSLGPVLQWMEQRVVSVCCAGSGHHYIDPRGDQYEQEDSINMFCRLEKGGLVEIRLDMLSNRPHNMTWYALQGTEGSYEASRGFGDDCKIWLASRSEQVEWKSLWELEQEFMPEEWRNPSEAQLQAGHGGGDYLEVNDFVQAILADKEPPIGMHSAMDMTLPGLVSQQSILQNSAWLDVPDSRVW